MTPTKNHVRTGEFFFSGAKEPVFISLATEPVFISDANGACGASGAFFSPEPFRQASFFSLATVPSENAKKVYGIRVVRKSSLPGGG